MLPFAVAVSVVDGTANGSCGRGAEFICGVAGMPHDIDMQLPIGSEEAMPVLFRVPTLAKALGVPYVPVTANLFAFGPLGAFLPFPAKFKLRVLDAVRFDVPSDQDRYSKSRIMEESEKIRTQIQEAVYDMLRDRRSVWFG